MILQGVKAKVHWRRVQCFEVGVVPVGGDEAQIMQGGGQRWGSAASRRLVCERDCAGCAFVAQGNQD